MKLRLKDAQEFMSKEFQSLEEPTFTLFPGKCFWGLEVLGHCGLRNRRMVGLSFTDSLLTPPLRCQAAPDMSRQYFTHAL